MISRVLKRRSWRSRVVVPTESVFEEESTDETNPESSSRNSESPRKILDVFLLPPSKSKAFTQHLRLKVSFQKQFHKMNLRILEDLEKQSLEMIEKLIPAIKVFTTSLSEDDEVMCDRQMTELDGFLWIISQVIQHTGIPNTPYEKQVIREYVTDTDVVCQKVRDLKKICQVYQKELRSRFLDLKRAFKSFVIEHGTDLRPAKLLFKEYKQTNFDPDEDEDSQEDMLQVSGQLKLKGTYSQLKIRGSVTELSGGDCWVDLSSLACKTQKMILECALREIKLKANTTGPIIQRTLGDIKVDLSTPDAWKSSEFQLNVNRLLATCQYRNIPFKKEDLTQVTLYWMKLISKFDHLFHLLKVTEDVARVTQKHLAAVSKNAKYLENGSPVRLGLYECYPEKLGKLCVVNLALYTNWPSGLGFIQCT